jgi:hypothetical protein
MKLMGERKVVETKADMKERTKGISPDDADAVVGLCDMFANEHGGEAKAAGGKARTWEQQAKRYNLVESYAG